MNWNDSLYWYCRERGGQLFASQQKKDSGVLFLDIPSGPAMIQCQGVSAYDGQRCREISVLLRASLAAPCYLTVRKDRFPREDPPSSGIHPPPAAGIPQLAARRSIHSSDPDLTPALLQNARLRELLWAEPGAWLQITPLQAGGLVHLVCVRKDGAHLEEALDPSGRIAARDEPNQRRLYTESGFREEMDGLVELAQTLRDGVRLWRRQKQNQSEGGT